jgi:hypothetical protein
MYSEDVVARGRLKSLVIHWCSFLAALIPFSGFGVASVTLGWDPDSNPNVVSHKVYYGVVSSTYTNWVTASSSTNATITGLVEGTTYYIAATAIDNLGQESDFSTEISYHVLIPVTQPPTLDPISNVTVNEGASTQTVGLTGISSGATNQPGPLTVTAASSNPALIPNPTVTYTSPNTTGSISFAPLGLGNGSAVITVTVNNGAASNNVTSRAFTVTVNPVNQAPTLNALNNMTVLETASLQTINLSGISSGATNENQTLTVTASSSNPGLIPNPSVTYTSPNTTGSISFAPLGLGNGSATITVTVNDGGASNNVVSRSFTVTVTPVNQAPTLNAINNVTVIENSGAQTVNLSGISSGATNENQTLTITATSSNTAVVPNPTVTYTSPNATGTLTFTPKANAAGTATVAVTVNDGGASNNIVTRTFNIVVDAPPTITSIANRTIAQDTATPALAFTIGDAETSASSLTVTASSSNQTLAPNGSVALGGSGANRTVTVTPVTGQTGASTITLTVSDGVASTSTSFSLTVQGRPSAPTNLHIASQ